MRSVDFDAGRAAVQAALRTRVGSRLSAPGRECDDGALSIHGDNHALASRRAEPGDGCGYGCLAL